MNKLDLIQKKCADANPEIWKAWTHVTRDENGHKVECDHKAVSRPIRLADVLFALRQSPDYGHYEPSVDCNGYFRSALGVVIGEGDRDMRWDLRQDDLTKQPQETIDFLYDILKADQNQPTN